MNYHAGDTGICGGMPRKAQCNRAGTGEIFKDLKALNMARAWPRMWPMILNTDPNGDRTIDCYLNTRGMDDATKAGLHP